MIFIPSKFCRKRILPIQMIVIHHTGTFDINSTISWFKPDKDRQTDLASAHYIIDDNGSIVQMVKLEDAAYHAGISKWTIDSKEYTNSRINDISIGIELVGDGNKMVYSEYQYQSLIRLLYELTYDGQIKSIVGHSDIAPGRKTDPGVYFDWDRIRKCHYGHLVKR